MRAEWAGGLEQRRDHPPSLDLPKLILSRGSQGRSGVNTHRLQRPNGET